MIIIFYDRSLLRISRRYVQRCSTRTILCQDQVTKLWQTVYYYYHLCGILVTEQIGELSRSETVQTVCQRIKMYLLYYIGRTKTSQYYVLSMVFRICSINYCVWLICLYQCDRFLAAAVVGQPNKPLCF